jgi:hypothetical protein
MGDTSLENSDQPSFDESDTEPTFSNRDFAKLKAWFQGQFELIRIDIGIVRTENDDLKQQLEDLRNDVDTKDRTIADLEANLMTFRNELDASVNRVSTFKDLLEKLELELDELQQYSQRASLRISGLPAFKPDDNYRQLVVDLASEVGVVMDLHDIDRAHPAGKDNKQLIVKFTNYTARFNLYNSRRKLKESNRNIYINEDLTPRRSRLLRDLIDLKKSKEIANAWTNDGRLFAWKNDRKHLIKSELDIDRLRGL